MEGVDRPCGVKAWIRADPVDSCYPMQYRVELGVVVVVLRDFLVTNFRLLVAEIDGDAVGQVEEGVRVVDDLVAAHEGDVLYFDRPSFAIAAADGCIFAAAHGEKDCSSQEVRPSSGAGVTGHAESIAEHNGGHGFLVAPRWVVSFVPCCLAPDVLVKLPPAV